jgi:molybdopterin converting factor small subunit
MIRVKLEMWMPLGKELGKGFQGSSERCSIREEEVKDGTTVRNYFDALAKSYPPIREKIFERGRGSFYSDVVVTLNDRVISPHELYDRALKDGDKITVLPVFAGG